MVTSKLKIFRRSKEYVKVAEWEETGDEVEDGEGHGEDDILGSVIFACSFYYDDAVSCRY